MKKHSQNLITRAKASLRLSIELFNRPYDEGRIEGILLLLLHSFEMLLKALIYRKNDTVYEKGTNHTYRFDKCIRIARDELKVIDKDQATYLLTLEDHRNNVAHFYQDTSEDMLYLLTQAGVTLFAELLNDNLGEKLADYLPSRVLPVSVKPPRDIQVLISSELSQVDALLTAGSRKGIDAAARMRSILPLILSDDEAEERVSETKLKKALVRRKSGEQWSTILPEIARLRLDTEGEGIPIYFKIAKTADLAVRIAAPGEDVIGIIKEVDWFSKYNLGLRALSKKLGLSEPKVRAYIDMLKVRENVDLYGEKMVDKTPFKRYTGKALTILREAILKYPVEEVWNQYKAGLTPIARDSTVTDSKRTPLKVVSGAFQIKVFK